MKTVNTSFCRPKKLRPPSPPSLLAEVSFGEWTQTGRVRHAVFHGLRTDKKATAILRETPVALPATTPTAPPVALPPTLNITSD